MHDKNEITYFGHKIPKEIYEDYENMEKIKATILDILSNSDHTNKDMIGILLTSMSKKFHQMEQSICGNPTPKLK